LGRSGRLLRLSQTGLAPGVPHLANLPFSRQRAGLAFAAATGGHLMNLPLASLHGAANAGDATIASALAAINIVRIILSSTVRIVPRALTCAVWPGESK
jgi:hypothetical protein